MVTDLRMPEMNGIDFVKAVRSKHGKDELPIVMVTTEGSEDRVREALSSGVQGYVVKPFTPEILSQRIEETLAKLSVD